MASEKEIRLQSKAVLFDLLKIKQAISNGNVEETVDAIIERATAFMDSDDVASVKEKIGSPN